MALGAGLAVELYDGIDPPAVLVTAGEGVGSYLSIAVHGDSNSAIGGATGWPALLSVRRSVPVYNLAVGGNLSGAAAAISNGDPAIVKDTFTIPADLTPVEMDLISPDKPLKNDSRPSYEVTFLGVHGTLYKLDYTLPNNPFTFVRSVAAVDGLPKLTPAGTPMITDLGLAHKDAPLTIIWVGGNDVGNKPAEWSWQDLVDAVMVNIIGMREYATGRVVVFSPPNGTGSEPADHPDSTAESAELYDGLQMLTAALSAEFGEDYFDLRGALVTRGIEVAQSLGFPIVRTDRDIRDEAHDTVPLSLRKDDLLGVHLVREGRAAVDYLVSEWLDDVDPPEPLPVGAQVEVTREYDGLPAEVVRGCQFQEPEGSMLVRLDLPPLGRPLLYRSTVLFPAVVPTPVTVQQVNAVPNPSAEVTTAGWGASNGALDRVTGIAGALGTYVFRLTASGGGDLLMTNIASFLGDGVFVPGEPVQFVAHVKAAATPGAQFGGIAVRWYNAAGLPVTNLIPGQVHDFAAWEWADVTMRMPANAVQAKITLLAYRTSDRDPALNGDVLYVDGIGAIYESAHPDEPELAYFDGGSPGASWTGGAHISTSELEGVRLVGGSDERLSYAQAIITVPDPGRHVITDPLDADSVYVDVVPSDDDRGNAYNGALVSVHNRRRSSSFSEIRSGDTGTAYWYTRNRAETDALRALLDRNTPLLSRHNNDGADEAAIECLTPLDYTRSRRWGVDRVAWNWDRLFTVAYAEADPPDPDTPTSAFTWADVAAAYAGRTWAEFTADWSTRTYVEFLREFRRLETVAPPVVPVDPGTGQPLPLVTPRAARELVAAFGMNTHSGFTGGSGVVTDPITWRAPGARVDVTVATTTINVPYPATVNAGDLLIVVYGSSGAATAPAGWTLVDAADSTNRTTVLYKHAVGTETGSLTITVPSQTGTAQMVSAYNVNGTTLDVAAVIAVTPGTTATTLTAVAANVVTTGAVAFYAATNGGGASTTYTGPAGSTELIDWGAAGSNVRAGAAYRSSAALTAGDAVSRTVTSSVARRQAMVLLVLRPTTSGSPFDPNGLVDDWLPYLTQLGPGFVRQKLYADAGDPRTNTRAFLQAWMAAGGRVRMPTLQIYECTSLAAARTAMDAYIAELTGNPGIYVLSQIDHFPGLNEPNGTAPGSTGAITYANWAARTAWAQQAIYERVRAVPGLAGATVDGPPLQRPSPARIAYAGAASWNVLLMAEAAQVGDLSAYIDGYADVHAYTGDRDLSDVKAPLIDAAHVIAPGRPVFVSEYGWANTSQDDPDGIGYAGGAQSLPATVTAHYAVKAPLTALDTGYAAIAAYELLENPPPYDTDQDHREGKFGYVRVPSDDPADWSAKPALTAVAFLLTLFRDPGPAPALQPLQMALSGLPADARWRLFVKRDGAYLLALWRHVQLYESDPSDNSGAYTSAAAVDVTLTLTAARAITVYEPSTSGAALSASTATAKVISLGTALVVVRLGAV